jgi:hypothetical protein
MITPLSLTSLLNTYGITGIDLTMGHLTHRVENSLLAEGIMMHVHSQWPLEDKALSQVASAFGAS